MREFKIHIITSDSDQKDSAFQRGSRRNKQEAQLSQRDRATLRVIEYFAKSHKVTQGHTKWQSLSGACVSRY